MKRILSRNVSIADLPALSCLEKVALQTIDLIPTEFKDKAKKIKIIVENYADPVTLKSLRIDDKYELLGLYRGTPIPIKTIFNDSSLPDSIYLYRGPLVKYSYENCEDINKLVHQVMVHELSHHFGGIHNFT